MLQSGVLVSTLVAMLIAVAACLRAAALVARCSQLTSALSRTMKDAEIAVGSLDEIRENVATLNDRYENLRSRVGMRETRAARAANPATGLSGAAWKDEMRKQLKLSVPGANDGPQP